MHSMRNVVYVPLLVWFSKEYTTLMSWARLSLESVHSLPVTVNHSYRPGFDIILKLHQLRAELVIENVFVLTIFGLPSPSFKVVITYNLSGRPVCHSRFSSHNSRS